MNLLELIIKDSWDLQNIKDSWTINRWGWFLDSGFLDSGCSVQCERTPQNRILGGDEEGRRRWFLGHWKTGRRGQTVSEDGDL